MAQWLRDAAWWQILLIALALNAATVASSVVLWLALVRSRDLAGLVRPLRRRDVVLTTTTTVINAICLLPAWGLWQRGTLELEAPSFPRIVLEIAYLIAAFETAMYAMHRFIHVGLVYRWTHGTHHTGNERMCPVSLFVMHPAEPAGFAGVVLVMLLVWPVSFPAVATFFAVNLLFGTYAHRPVRPGAEVRWTDRHLGGAVLHQGHHHDEATNFGFFTSFWDTALRTRSTRREPYASKLL